MEPVVVSLGIDISKATFHAAVLKDDKRAMVKEFSNDRDGFVQLSEWLKHQGLEEVHECMEATKKPNKKLLEYTKTQASPAITKLGR
jgi:transposase